MSYTHRPLQTPPFQSGTLIQITCLRLFHREPVFGFGCWTFRAARNVGPAFGAMCCGTISCVCRRRAIPGHAALPDRLGIGLASPAISVSYTSHMGAPIEHPKSALRAPREQQERGSRGCAHRGGACGPNNWRRAQWQKATQTELQPPAARDRPGVMVLGCGRGRTAKHSSGPDNYFPFAKRNKPKNKLLTRSCGS